MLGLGTMIYLIARTVPRIGDEAAEEIIKPKNGLDRWLASSHIERLDELFNNSVEKLLRKIKLMLMKLDNIVSDYLDRVKKYKLGENNQKNGEEKPGLFNKKNNGFK